MKVVFEKGPKKKDAMKKDATKKYATKKDATKKDATKKDATKKDATKKYATKIYATQDARNIKFRSVPTSPGRKFCHTNVQSIKRKRHTKYFREQKSLGRKSRFLYDTEPSKVKCVWHRGIARCTGAVADFSR